ncbi:chondroitinase-B domain-containing protein [Flavicella sediminum]|uniref:chondroitinase-B domain-containing protein n=1 Tax=Flavicella sediminum TaxID=2585141 RepID=UPI0011247836|nr:chondroitinase-B domain-containing protein [Flavicella sediminum]
MKKNYLFQIASFLICLLFVSFNVTAQNKTYEIDDPEDLRNVFYQPGDEIILKNGTYTTDERIRFLGSGTAENPVTFRAETPGGVVFTGGPRLTIGGESEDDGTVIATGDYLVVDGFHWKGGYGASNFIEFRNGYDYADHSTIQNCVIDGLGVEPSELAEDLADNAITKHRWIVLYGTYNTVINCSFMNKTSAGAIVLAEYSYNAFPNVPDGQPEINNSCELVGHTISNNYFYNFEKMDPTLSNSGDSETIRIGTSEYQMVNSGATVSNNYFVQSDGENEIITNKSKNNTYYNNTFRRCRGSLVLRHGSNATVEQNYFLGEDVDGTGGIRITDSDHTIRNNYIQDCIAVTNQAKWNNGITFIGGSANAAVACTSTDVSNGYQKTENIEVSNNTIINTNAPLFYNTDKGSTDPKGTISNNLIYFESGDANLSDVISGEYASLGTALTYTNNSFKGTNLGVTNSGFSEATGITATAIGEIFTFSGAAGKGANMGSYAPTTDANVGYGIGACFVDYTGANITDGECIIVIPEPGNYLTIGSLPTFSAAAGNSDVAVAANVSWTAVSNDDWITINPASGTANGTVSVSVTKNSAFTSRTGSVTFSEVAGGDDIVKTLTISQEAADVRSNFTLINDASENDQVSVASVFNEEVTSTKNNVAIHSLDKDTNTQWSGEGVPGEIVYDLGGAFDLTLIDFATTKGKTYEFQIWVSTTGTASGDFVKAFTDQLNGSGNLVSNSKGEFESYLLSEVIVGVKYVKVIGYGQPARPSNWNTIKEIEFYKKNSDLSVDDIKLNKTLIYYSSSDASLHLENLSNVNTITLYSVEGRKIVSNAVNSKSEAIIDVANLVKGIYVVQLNGGNAQQSKLVLIGTN